MIPKTVLYQQAVKRKKVERQLASVEAALATTSDNLVAAARRARRIAEALKEHVLIPKNYVDNPAIRDIVEWYRMESAYAELVQAAEKQQKEQFQ